MLPSSSIFADWAEKLHQVGLAVIPCGGNDGKQALIKWKPFKEKGIGPNALEQWTEQFPAANIGVLLGKASGIVVVDDDANRDPEEIYKEFGYTPLSVKTPSKGGHYYYRYNGEVSTNLKSRKIEIKSTGTIVLLPPSVSPINGNAYTFINGGFSVDFLDDLPNINLEAIKAISSEKVSEFRGGFQEGERNTALFDYLRSIAFQCVSMEELIESASVFNTEKVEEPLNHTEVEKTAKSVWRYKLSGNLIAPGTQYACSTLGEIKELTPDEHWLMDIFKANHKGLRPEFAVVPSSIAKAYFQITEGRVKKAITGLLRKEFIKQTHIGGKGPRDPHKYEFVLRG